MRWLCVWVCLLGGCKKKADTGTDGGLGPPPPSIDQRLQVSNVSPPVVAPGVTGAVQVVGAGFQPGSWVRISGVRAPAVQFMNENVLSVTVPPLVEGVYDVTVQNPDGANATLRGGLRATSQTSGGVVIDRQRCGSVVVYFDTDQAGVSPTARSRLDGVMDCYTQGTHAIQLAGHADARGTTDYNLALGQRRAEAVREYLVRAGVPASRLPVTTWGEERPADAGGGESAWAKNRRVELIIP